MTLSNYIVYVAVTHAVTSYNKYHVTHRQPTFLTFHKTLAPWVSLNSRVVVVVVVFFFLLFPVVRLSVSLNGLIVRK